MKSDLDPVDSPDSLRNGLLPTVPCNNILHAKAYVTDPCVQGVRGPIAEYSTGRAWLWQVTLLRDHMGTFSTSFHGFPAIPYFITPYRGPDLICIMKNVIDSINGYFFFCVWLVRVDRDETNAFLGRIEIHTADGAKAVVVQQDIAESEVILEVDPFRGNIGTEDSDDGIVTAQFFLGRDYAPLFLFFFFNCTICGSLGIRVRGGQRGF